MKVTLQDGQSLNIQQENIEALQQLFPELVRDGKVNFDVFRQVFGDLGILEEGEEKFGLNWHGKKKARQNAFTPSLGTLLPCPEESVDWDTTQNLFIEGDNLEVLKLLQKSYANKVKMIYIDPPYNTGNEFIYPDNFKENLKNYLEYTNQIDSDGELLSSDKETRGRKHTSWLNMIYPRLILAKNLLTTDGVIFISIDNNEINNLISLCDEIYGSENRLGIIANVNNPKGRSDDKFFATAHEYLLCYSKNSAYAKIFGFEAEEVITKRYNKIDEQGKKYREIDLRKTGDSDKRSDRPDMFYYFYYDPKKNYLEVSKDQKHAENGILEIMPLKDDDSEGRWRWGFDTAKDNLDKVYAKFMPSRKIWGIFEKDYLEGRPPVKPTTAWTFKDVNSERGSEQFIELGFDKEVFPRPKPIGTLKRVIELGTLPDEKALVLDFFAGSATIFQSAFELNAQGKRNVRVIGVQIPEKLDGDNKKDEIAVDFCNREGLPLTISSISKARIRRAGAVLKDEGYNIDIGFKVLKLAQSNIRAWDAYSQDLENVLDLNEDHLVEGRTELDVLYELLLKRGIDLATPIEKREINSKTLYSIGYGAVFACLDDSILASDLDVITSAIIEWHKELAPSNDTHIFFKDSAFQDDVVKTNLAAILEQNGLKHVRSL